MRNIIKTLNVVLTKWQWIHESNLSTRAQLSVSVRPATGAQLNPPGAQLTASTACRNHSPSQTDGSSARSASFTTSRSRRERTSWRSTSSSQALRRRRRSISVGSWGNLKGAWSCLTPSRGRGPMTGANTETSAARTLPSGGSLLVRIRGSSSKLWKNSERRRRRLRPGGRWSRPWGRKRIGRGFNNNKNSLKKFVISRNPSSNKNLNTCA